MKLMRPLAGHTFNDHKTNDSILRETADWMHTRQDRWIQKELAFTPAKNATQPNPFKIIAIQSTRKENNRKTEETLARAAATLETERAKWPNPWCLWWWKVNESCLYSLISLATKEWTDQLAQKTHKLLHALQFTLSDLHAFPVLHLPA